MGTNYYHEPHDMVAHRAPRCTECGGKLLCNTCEPGRVHIGKSSAGWTFTFHATDTIRSYADWIAALERRGAIVDDYGRVHTLAEFRAMVESKRSAPSNHAVLYPEDGRNYLDPEGHAFSEGDFS